MAAEPPTLIVNSPLDADKPGVRDPDSPAGLRTPSSEPATEPTRTAGSFRNEPRRAPSMWGSLRIMDEIGAGAYGHVYRAWDEALAREVALKIIPLEVLDQRAAPSLLREGQMLARV